MCVVISVLIVLPWDRVWVGFNNVDRINISKNSIASKNHPSCVQCLAHQKDVHCKWQPLPRMPAITSPPRAKAATCPHNWKCDDTAKC